MLLRHCGTCTAYIESRLTVVLGLYERAYPDSVRVCCFGLSAISALRFQRTAQIDYIIKSQQKWIRTRNI